MSETYKVTLRSYPYGALDHVLISDEVMQNAVDNANAVIAAGKQLLLKENFDLDAKPIGCVERLRVENGLVLYDCVITDPTAAKIVEAGAEGGFTAEMAETTGLEKPEPTAMAITSVSLVLTPKVLE